jgi:hypothetical protein
MKNLKYILLVVIGMTAFSCTDLETLPRNTLLPNTLFTEEGAYISYLAKLYGSMTLTGQDGPAGNGDLSIINDEGFGSYIRAYWKAQTLTTDEAMIRWTDAGIQDLNYMTWSSDNQFVRVMYYRIMYTISLCNDFLAVSSSDQLDANGISEAYQAEVDIYRAEARFIRALAYWHALDIYQNVPILTKISSELPTQSSGEDVYNFIISELDAIESTLVAPEVGFGPFYGRASKAALWMLRAKVKLNHPKYVGAETTTIYNEVIDDLDNVINAGYSLEADYYDVFKADNHTSPEIIFPLTHDGTNSQSWGGTTFMVRAALFDGMEADSLFGVNGGWSGVITTRQFNDRFETAGVLDYSDGRNVIFTEGRTEIITENFTNTLTEGYASAKYSNVTKAGDAGSNPDWVDTDFPMFRLADAYLMYAEAVLRGASNGNRAAALGYVNQIRQRAYGDNSGDILDADLTLDFLLEERGRELYFEAHRRTDLIRFNKYSNRAGGEEFIWDWKGRMIDGVSMPSHLEIFPIPASELGVNSNLTQNTGY